MKLAKPIEGARNNLFNFHSLSLKDRLWVLQILLIFTLLISIFSVLLITGMIPVFHDTSYMLVKKQLDDSAMEFSQKYAVISANTVELAERINKSMEKNLATRGLTISELKSHPQLLETILGREVEKAVFAMQKTNVSGVFVFLDATVNPNLSQARDSKAGFYIIDMDPNVMPYSSDALFLLYGPPAIARENGMYLHTEWELEYDTGIQKEERRTDFYQIPLAAAARNKGAELQNLGYWSPFFKPAEHGEQAMAFSVPLVDQHGIPYGVCGLEISRTFFEKLMPPPVSSLSDEMVLLFSSSDAKGISMKNAGLISDNSGWLPEDGQDYLLSTDPPKNKENFKQYYFDVSSQSGMLGLDTTVSLYPSKSVYKDEKWVLTALVPQTDVEKKTHQAYLALAAFLSLLTLGIVASYYTSRHYVEPIVNTLNKIKECGLPASKTNIPEIDDFIEFLKQHPYEPTKNVRADTAMVSEQAVPMAGQTPWDLDKIPLTEFTQQLETLSRAEREVFDLYIKGHTAKEISKILFISINTVKSHNKKIYAKMNVSSRAELLVYCYKLMLENQE
ncbi:helix-turn-helix domain-containing protein [Candidatus Formimonas warabiya]|uniref:HTH luxR-type domain-containing protein n=1 Tax=Formimonas warabiya TaxID=1761012 RepID=A0A3G1KRT6_FORW1|nr:helix-turn-helix transcriptional regulator [Candidatus Formimonas warabiya]ATW25156.1 hypothetical protein DCMF_10590 [Candidatus Formimonas warabiya]